MCVKYSTTTSYSYRLLFSIVHLFGCRVLFCAPFLVFTARKRSLRRLCFYTCLSVILFTGGGGESASVGVYIQGDLHPEGSPSRGVGQTLPHRILRDTVNERAVHSLLECILVTCATTSYYQHLADCQ